MSAEARMQPDPLEKLTAQIGDEPKGYDLLAEYVAQVCADKHEEDVFRDLAFRGPAAHPGEALGLYDGLSDENKAEARRLWHEKVRSAAYDYDDLRTRLSWRFRV